MAGFYRDEMAANPAADQGKIANKIEDFVANKLVLEAKRFFAQHRVAAHHNRVLETAALDQILVHERLDVFVINEGARRRQLALENRRRDLSRQILREPIVRASLRAGDAELFVREQDEQCAGF